MKRRVAQGSLTLFFLALLATPLVLRQLSVRRERALTATSAEDAIRRYGLYLEEVSRAAGIDFTHHPPKLDARLDHIMPEIASLGAAVSVADFDHDGWQDLYVTNSRAGSRNALYRNLGDGTFHDVAVEVGLADVNQPETGVSMGSVWGDYDNDGYEDLFLYKWGRSELFHNEGGEEFTSVTERAGFPAWANANTAVWFDYDRDGNLDLFIGGYYSEDVNLWKLTSTRIMPESFEYAHNGGRNYLLRNRGDGTFADVSEQMGLEGRRWTLAAAAADLSGTGYPDLFVANEYGVDELFINQQGERFVHAGERTGIGFMPKSGMNAALGDVLNQGSLGIYVSNISEPGVLLQGNNLWLPDADGGGQRFRNLAGAMGVELGGWSYAAQFGDLNNDGALDLYLVNGFVSADRRSSYWYDFSLVAGGHSAIISDAKNWPAMEGRSLSGYQRSRVWLNDGAGRFNEVAQVVGASDLYDGRAVALVDLWNRGVLDVVVANQGGPLLIYKNTVTPANSWIGFELEGSHSNRSAIGARVEVFWNGVRQVQEVSGGSGFSAQNQRPLHFGLGPSPRVEKVVISWPAGNVQSIAAPRTGVVHKVQEPS